MLAKCAVKLKPFLKEAVEFSGLSLDGYHEIVTKICNGSNGEVELDDVNVSKEQVKSPSYTVSYFEFTVQASNLVIFVVAIFVGSENEGLNVVGRAIIAIVCYIYIPASLSPMLSPTLLGFYVIFLRG